MDIGYSSRLHSRGCMDLVDKAFAHGANADNTYSDIFIQ
jgi:hypothetical protein